jgi:hypothetical protein
MNTMIEQALWAIPEDVLTRDSDPSLVAKLGGGKGHNLFLLTQAGIAVPRWAILSSELCGRFLEAAGLAPVIMRLMANDDPDAIEAAIMAAPMGDAIVKAVAAAHAQAGGGRVAVRSSGREEDGGSLSFAGQYASFLNLSDADEILAHVKKCWASAYSERCLAYRRSNGLALRVEPIACVVQAMVDAEKSGVAFTANPMTGDTGEIVISAVYGLGEGLVSGAIDADLVVLGHDGVVRETLVGEKLERLVPCPAGGHIAIRTDPALAKALCLSAAEIDRLHRTAQAIEHLFGVPQDIEWSIDAAGDLHILQARPVTASQAAPLDPGGAARIWENSNIIESFGGMTSPMTFSFARDVYHEVFKEYCRILGVPRRALVPMDAWLRAMLGYHNGRVYYNLLNWYKVLRLAPTYQINWRMLEFSIGAQESISDEAKAGLEPLAATGPAMRKWVYARMAWRSLVYFFAIEGSVNRFLRDFGRLHGAYDAIDYTALPVGEIHRIFMDLRHRFIAQFGRMIVLEQMISLSVGVLGLLTKRWLPDAPAGFFLDMVRPESALESLEPVERLTELADLVDRDADLAQLVRATSPDAMAAMLAASSLPSAAVLATRIEAYVADFGYRCVNEMKLEEPDIREDPAVFFTMLKSNLGQVRRERPSADMASADGYLRAHLGWFRRTIYLAVRRKARRLLAARERVRFCRTRVFGTARRMVKAIGGQLESARAIDDRRDIFLLRIEELTGWFCGIVPPQELRPLIELRRRLAVEQARLDPPGRFETHGIIAPGDYARHGWLAGIATAPAR